MKGRLALLYGDLIKKLWNGANRSLMPLELRWMLAKYAPQFSGFQQHDAQEALAFLIDGLHEDLNRSVLPAVNDLISQTMRQNVNYVRHEELKSLRC